jgi:hypothetical protein
LSQHHFRFDYKKPGTFREMFSFEFEEIEKLFSSKKFLPIVSAATVWRKETFHRL